jgi:hypothetical protein
LAFCATCFARLHACVDVVEFLLVVALEHLFKVREEVTAPPYSFAFADFPFALLAL